ncbi:unnamed protein product, partial [Rotaria sordida]
WLTAIKKAGG